MKKFCTLEHVGKVQFRVFLGDIGALSLQLQVHKGVGAGKLCLGWREWRVDKAGKGHSC